MMAAVLFAASNLTLRLRLCGALATRFQLLSTFPTQANKTQLDEAPLTVGTTPLPRGLS